MKDKKGKWRPCTHALEHHRGKKTRRPYRSEDPVHTPWSLHRQEEKKEGEGRGVNAINSKISQGPKVKYMNRRFLQ